MFCVCSTNFQIMKYIQIYSCEVAISKIPQYGLTVTTEFITSHAFPFLESNSLKEFNNSGCSLKDSSATGLTQYSPPTHTRIIPLNQQTLNLCLMKYFVINCMFLQLMYLTWLRLWHVLIHTITRGCLNRTHLSSQPIITLFLRLLSHFLFCSSFVEYLPCMLCFRPK